MTDWRASIRTVSHRSMEHLRHADVFHEGSGLLMAVLAAWVALAWRQLVTQRRDRPWSA